MTSEFSFGLSYVAINPSMLGISVGKLELKLQTLRDSGGALVVKELDSLISAADITFYLCLLGATYSMLYDFIHGANVNLIRDCFL